ncbi:glycosyltransferase family 4 protein [Microvirga aerilata]|uniref:glycosyltransferase family 4 protein n=1 Tax=Microvirga aerilata TaxID=670292 RepID=UPI003642488B
MAHVTEAPLGGVLTYLQELIPLQLEDARIASIEVLAPEVNVKALSSIESDRIKLRSFAHSRGSLLGLLRLALATIRVVRQSRPDILHIHSTVAGALVRCCLLVVPGRPKIIYCPHSWAFAREGSRLKNGAIAAIERLLVRVTDRIICVSNCEKTDAIAWGIPSPKCVVIENGIKSLTPPTTIDGYGSSAYRRRKKILFVGRFDRQKGFDVFAEIMKELQDSEGIAIGDFIVNRAETIEIPSNVTTLGWRSREEVEEIYSTADLLLMPSRWEGLPLTALEAMRAGVPIFASRAGGLKDVVVDGVTGRLFDLGSVKSIADLIRATDEETLREFGKSGRAHFLERYRADLMSKKIMDLYLEMLP